MMAEVDLVMQLKLLLHTKRDALQLQLNLQALLVHRLVYFVVVHPSPMQIRSWPTPDTD